MTACRICGSGIEPFMSFGKMPISNAFLTFDQIKCEPSFEMEVASCGSCGMFQLIEQPAPETMFHESYAFYSSTSRYMQAHFERFALSAIEGPLAGRKNPFVVELGSNDGIMLRHFKERGIRHLGVEPSANVADVARVAGINTISEFFNLDLANEIVAEFGQADLVLAANVMCHIPDMNSVAAGMARLLKPDGLLMFEDPYLGDVIAKTSYDQIYDEHVFLFSATSIATAFARHGLELVDLLPQVTHGGSMRYVLASKGSRPAAPAVVRVLAQEESQGLGRPDTYVQFKRNCEASREALIKVLNDLRAVGKRIVGYAATAKSATVTNYCGIGPQHLEFISDTTPIKQGKLSPGAHIPVKPYAEFERHYPDYALLFAWNHAEEIRAKEKRFVEQGGKWIVYVPKVSVL